MIESISLRNVQAHKDTYIELDPGVNVFIGLSDAGKSTIMRAIDWWGCDGNSISPKNEQNKNVTIMVDGRKISKSRSGRAYKYQIDDGSYFSGKSIPEEILNICEFSSINFQNQFDPPFMVMDKGTDRSKSINELVDLKGMDVCKSGANTEALNIQREISFLNKQIEEMEIKIKKMNSILGMSNFVRALEKKGATITNNIKVIENIKKICSEIAKIRSDFLEYQAIKGISSDVDDLLISVKKMQSTDRIITSITLCINELKDVRNRQASINTDSIEKSVNELLQLCMEYVNTEKEMEQINLLIKELNLIQANKTSNARMLNSLKVQFVLPKICPLCNQFICKKECNKVK